MKQFFLILFLLISSCSYSQEKKDTLFKYTPDLTPYEGTWIYENEDTVFVLQLKNVVWDLTVPSGAVMRNNCIIGGYSLSVKGELIDDYIRNLPTNIRNASERTPEGNVYIFGRSNFDTKEALEEYMKENGPSVQNIHFYDQRNKQYDEYGHIKETLCTLTWYGDGFDCLRWHIMTEEEMYARYRGELFPIPRSGHSVPIDAILKKINKK